MKSAMPSFVARFAVMLAFVAFAVNSIALANVARAQDQEIDLSALDELDAPTSQDAASEPENDATSPNAAAQTTAPIVKERSHFVVMLLAGGWIGGVLFLASILAIAIALKIFVATRRDAFTPAELGRELATLVSQGDYRGARARVDADDSFLGIVARAGLREVDRGWLAVEKALEDAVAEESSKRARRTDPLDVIGNVAPMLGLLGTVLGMVSTFGELAVSDGSGRNLANGIYFALVTTVEGLIVAIPVLVARAWLNARIADRVSDSVQKLDAIFEPAKRALAVPRAQNANIGRSDAAAVESGLREVARGDAQERSGSQRQTLSLKSKRDA